MILRKIKEHREDLVIRGLFLRPPGGILKSFWSTVGAYPFDRLKKHESSATAEKWGPAEGSQALGETLNK